MVVDFIAGDFMAASAVEFTEVVAVADFTVVAQAVTTKGNASGYAVSTLCKVCRSKAA